MEKYPCKCSVPFFVLICFTAAWTQIPKRPNLLPAVFEDDRLSANAVNDVHINGASVWIATGNGLDRSDDRGETWTHITASDGLGKGGVSALAFGDGIIWAATAFDTLTEVGGELPAGGGLGWSTDGGASWTWFSQPVDPVDLNTYKPTTTNVQNLTYDIALSDSAVWITSFGGGLRKSTDRGENWEVVTVDGRPFDALGYLAHRTFSVIFDGEALWVGSADGVHKSTDEGRTWITFNHQNQPQSISGNFVVALHHQEIDGAHRLWAATIEAMDETETRAVSFTEDGGYTWQIALEGEFAHNFASSPVEDVVYAATDNGLFVTRDGGRTWASFAPIVDPVSGASVLTNRFYSVGTSESDLWAGSADGLARTSDAGLSWKVFRAYRTAGQGGEPDVYAYPNPFSPSRHNLLGGDGHVRFQYSTDRPTRVDCAVYDYGMRLVRSVTERRERSVAGSYAEIWDGRNDVGDVVANGVYFFKIALTYGEPMWGKVIVAN